MKRTFFIMTMALFIAMMSMTGCPQDVDGGNTAVKSVTLDKTTLALDMQVTKTSTLTATIVNGGAGDTVTWTSGDTEYVTISGSGLTCTVTAVKATTAPVTITAALSGDSSKTAVCLVTVAAEPEGTYISLNDTSLTLDVDDNQTATLTATIVNGEDSDSVTWTSSDTTNEFITISGSGLSCTVTAVKATTAPVTITAALSSDSSVKNTCQVTVTGGAVIPSELELKLFTNATAESAGHASATKPLTAALPAPAGNVYTVNSGYNAGNWGSTGRFADTTFVYVDKLIEGNFKFRARVQVGAFPASTSNSRGMMVGAFKPNEDGNLVQNSSVAALFLRGNSAVRGAFPRAGDNASVGGMDLSVNRLNEFIYEFQRTDSGFVSTVYVSKTGTDVLATNSTSGFANGTNAYEIQADTPVYAGVALMCVEDVRISQLELWIDDLDGTPVFYSGNSTAATVLVDTVKLGVEGGSVTTGGTDPGSAANPAAYIVKASDVTTSGIQLVPSFVPTYADDLRVMYFKNDGGSANLAIDANTGKVTVTGTGTATFYAQSYSNEGAMYYLTITATADYLPIQDFTITGGQDTITPNQTITLSTDISAEIIAASDPEVVWAASSTDVKFVVGGEEVDTATGLSVTVKGISATASVTITATATTQDGANTPDVKTATKVIAVQGDYNPLIWEWNKNDGYTSGSELKGVDVFTTGGTVTANSDGNLVMGNNRFVLGRSTAGTNTANNVHTEGSLDLSKKFKITVVYEEVERTAENFYIYLNNNTTSGANSVVRYSATGTPTGNPILIQAQPTAGVAQGTLTVTIDPATQLALSAEAITAGLDKDTVLSSSFLQFRCGSTFTKFVISSIKLEYVED
jgi:hypothetical protein